VPTFSSTAVDRSLPLDRACSRLAVLVQRSCSITYTPSAVGSGKRTRLTYLVGLFRNLVSRQQLGNGLVTVHRRLGSHEACTRFHPSNTVSGITILAIGGLSSSRERRQASMTATNAATPYSVTLALGGRKPRFRQRCRDTDKTAYTALRPSTISDQRTLVPALDIRSRLVCGPALPVHTSTSFQVTRRPIHRHCCGELDGFTTHNDCGRRYQEINSGSSQPRLRQLLGVRTTPRTLEPERP
jgi:hypothetical protein